MKRNDLLSPATARASLRGPLAFGGSHVAVCSSALGAGVALAACAFALPTPGTDNIIEMQLTPAGEFRPSDGREMKVPAWRIDAAIAAKAIAATTARQTPPVVDYEHQTLRKEENGQPAPAAGWIKALTWHEGRGLFATVELTARAKQQIADGEYRYVSPVFAFHKRTGDVLDIRMAALTNTPAIDGMEPLALRAAASYGLTLDDEEDPMNKKLLAALCAVFAIAESAANDDALIAAATAAKAKLDGYDGLVKALGVKADAKPEEVLAACSARIAELGQIRDALGIAGDVATDVAVTACAALKAKADASGSPDPKKYVEVSVVESLKKDIAALSARHVETEVNDLVESGLADGRLLPAQKQWATDLGKKDVAALSAYLKTAEPIAALRGSQTGGRNPVDAGDNAHGLTADELAVCSATGLAPEDFAKAKKG